MRQPSAGRVCGLLLGAAIEVLANSASAATATPIVVDTDIMGDVDDVGALSVLHALADNGEARILGVVVNTANPAGAACVDVINTYYGRPETVVGTLKPNVAGDPTPYQKALVDGFPHALKDGTAAPDAVATYRQLLAAAPDQSVVIVSVGFLTNLQALLASPADAVSAMTGGELAKSKVAKLVVMGGIIPKGAEYNFFNDRTATKTVVENWPTSIVYEDGEVGQTIVSGRGLGQTPATNPIRKAYEVYSGAGMGRQSWDPLAVLYAVRGDGALFKESDPGKNLIGDDGSNQWMATPDGHERYLIKIATDDQITAALDKLLLKPPDKMQPPVAGAPSTGGTAPAGGQSTVGGSVTGGGMTSLPTTAPRSSGCGCLMTSGSAPASHVACLAALLISMVGRRKTPLGGCGCWLRRSASS